MIKTKWPEKVCLFKKKKKKRRATKWRINRVNKKESNEKRKGNIQNGMLCLYMCKKKLKKKIDG